VDKSRSSAPSYGRRRQCHCRREPWCRLVLAHVSVPGTASDAKALGVTGQTEL
jgi:hypothetical protein